MEEYKIQQKKRRIKQLLASIIFIAILSLGWHYPLLGYFIPLCMLLGIAFGIRRGRKWCDWYCPRGSFYDSLLGSISPKKEIPAIFKNIYFRLAVLGILFMVMGFNLYRSWPDLNNIGLFFVAMLTATTVLGVILALIFHQRSWCSFCPIGTMVNLIGKNKYPLMIDSKLCAECGLCEKLCPIQIKPQAYKSSGKQMVKDGDCLKCNLCVTACPEKALSRQ